MQHKVTNYIVLSGCFYLSKRRQMQRSARSEGGGNKLFLPFKKKADATLYSSLPFRSALFLPFKKKADATNLYLY